MQAEGVSWSALARVDPAPHAHHWQRSLAFLTLIRDILDDAQRHHQGLVRALQVRYQRTRVDVFGPVGNG